MNKVCKECGRIVSEKETNCPECGGELTSFNIEEVE